MSFLRVAASRFNSIEPALVAVLVIGFAIGFALGNLRSGWATLGSREEVVIDEADLTFSARLDTGATVSSINAMNIAIEGYQGPPKRAHAGKVVRFTLVNNDGQSAQVESVVDQVRGIRTSDCSELRYHVYLTVEFAGERYRILMNLNDRSGSKDKLLLGRNWLRHGFSVDVSRVE